MKKSLKGIAVLLCAASPFMAGTLQAQSIKITPGYITIGVGQKVQYTASTTGLSDTSVSWYVGSTKGGNSTYGTITQAGLYTAPATIPSNSITVTARGSDNITTATVYVNVAPPGPVVTSLTPNPVTSGNATLTLTGTGFKAGGSMLCNGVQLSAVVTATTATGGAWIPSSATTMTCSLSNPGTLYSTPITVPVVAPSSGGTGSGGTGSTGSAPVVSPSTVTVVLGATQQFSASGATSWSATSGTVSSTGLYTAPAVMPVSGTDTVTATNSTGSGTAKVTLISNVPPTITSISSASLPLGAFSTTITGSGFVATTTAALGSATLTVNKASSTSTTLVVSGFATNSGAVNLVVSNGSIASAPYQVQVGIANALVSAATARRFLEQAAFGPTPTEASHVQQVGLQGWLNEQFAMTPVSNYNAIITSSQGGLTSNFLANAVTNPDQLRQRVAFALSQIFVTSINKLIWNQSVIPYQQMLMADAFGNYRQLLADVTLSPGMGQFLDMANNAKATPGSGNVANENYAREVLQLFSIGTKILNPDGSAQVDSNNLPVPTYSQFTVTEFARVFTGWTYAPAAGQPIIWGAYITQNGPMVPYAPMHDSGSKTLLNGLNVPAGLSPQQDLDAALDNIFNHSNVGPFIGKQLIQHLVKSNPSPAYVQRVAAVFADNGQGVRGDLQAVITAILLDPEARANDNGGNDQVSDGHLQEPALFIPAIYRAFGGTMSNQNYFPYDMQNLNEDIYNPPSVFNYFSPFFHAPGSALFGPEFQIDTPNNAVYRANLIWNIIASSWNVSVQSYGPGTQIDFTPFVSLASTPATLADALDLTLTHGTMPPALKTMVINAITAETNGNVFRVQTGIYTILASGYYNVWH